MSGTGNQRVVGECVSCGNVYAAYHQSDGRIRPIGRKEGCQCGSTEFRLLEDESSIPPRGTSDSEKRA